MERRLRTLLATTDAESRLQGDPIAFPHRYRSRDDIEVAAVFASGLAFGRVAAFAAVTRAILDQADARGGPAHWIRTFSDRDAARLAPLQYRWIRGADLALLARALGRVLAAAPTLEDAFLAHDRPSEATIAPGLEGLVRTLRTAAMAAADRDDWTAMSAGLRYLLPVPSGGSACKRWCMFLRWMVRRPGPGAAGVDFGLWRGVAPQRLVMPIDTHVHRICGLMGLTTRATASWKTAVQLTESLRRFSPADPVKHDFALAHLGISGQCRARWSATVCPACALEPVCAAAHTRN